MGAGTSTGAGSVPLPPADLADRVLTAGAPDPVGRLDAFGRSQRELVLSALPRGWSFQDKRVLDFGCGPGTLLRHFIAEAGSAEFYGCDIDAPSIAWLEEHLSPPLHVFVNDERPPLPLPDRRFDLVLAIGVFAQITDQWSAWLAELHRVLADGGLMIATIMSASMWPEIAGEPWDENLVGMNAFDYGATWERDGHGPMVLHSPWWLETRWGRIFDVEIGDDIATDVGRGRHTIVKLRKRAGGVSTEQLEQPAPYEPREATAMQHQIRQMQRELAALREEASGCSNPARSRTARAST